MLGRYVCPKVLHLFKVRNLPAVPLRDRESLPKVSGVYYCLRGWEVLYIGKASNIYTRWNSWRFGEHDKSDELLEIEETRGDVDIHFIELPSWQISWYEAVEINRFKPTLNKRRESIWGNLNFQVVKLLAARGIAEFIWLACLGLLIVTLIQALSY
jgi:hypothetical protein